MPYRLLSYAGADGATPGLLIGDNVHDLAAEVAAAGKDGAFSTASVQGVLDGWEAAAPVLAAIADNPDGGSAKPLGDVKLLAPIANPGAIYCAAANYYDHAKEMTGKDLDKSTLEPLFFIKSSSVVIGPGEDIRLPQNYSKQYDWEGEIAAVIGRNARNLSIDAALDCVAGYTIFNDLSAREMGKRDDWPFGMDWVRHKSFDTSGPMGPWITPRSEIADVQSLAIKTTISGTVRQDSSAAQMVFSVAELISSLSRQLTLRPGDLVSTGTCAGVGAATGDFLSPGDDIHIEIEGLGVLANPVTEGD